MYFWTSLIDKDFDEWKNGRKVNVIVDFEWGGIKLSKSFFIFIIIMEKELWQWMKTEYFWEWLYLLGSLLKNYRYIDSTTNSWQSHWSAIYTCTVLFWQCIKWSTLFQTTLSQKSPFFSRRSSVEAENRFNFHLGNAGKCNWSHLLT